MTSETARHVDRSPIWEKRKKERGGERGSKAPTRFNLFTKLSPQIDFVLLMEFRIPDLIGWFVKIVKKHWFGLVMVFFSKIWTILRNILGPTNLIYQLSAWQKMLECMLLVWRWRGWVEVCVNRMNYVLDIFWNVMDADMIFVKMFTLENFGLVMFYPKAHISHKSTEA